MQKALILTLALISPLMVEAQQRQQPRQTISEAEVVEAMPENISAPQQVSPQQVYVVQNAPTQSNAQVVRTQPVTVVEDTPLKESRAEALRRSRVDVEQETETRIVEKLETERLKAEKERADNIMQALEGKKKEEPVYVAPPVQSSPFQYPAATQQVQVAPVQVVESSPVITSDVLKEEMKSESSEERSRFFIGGLGGYADYPGYKNIQGKYAAGFNLGIQFPERIIIEGSMIFSRYDLEVVPAAGNYTYNYYGTSEFMTIKQTNVTIGAKYRLLEGRMSPVVGVLAGYTRRDYTRTQGNYYYPSQYNDIKSQAFDMGLSGGLTIDLNKNFALDFDLKYMFNLSYSVDTTYKESLMNHQANGRKTPEELDYVLIGVGGKVQF